MNIRLGKTTLIFSESQPKNFSQSKGSKETKKSKFPQLLNIVIHFLFLEKDREAKKSVLLNVQILTL